VTSTLPRVAVIVPVYNGVATIGDCLDSLLRLDYPAARHEVIVVDNASTDATPRILADYGGQIRVCLEERRGAAAARNRGLRATGADVVAFTTAECTVEPGWLRALVAPLIDPGIGATGGRVRGRAAASRIEAFGEHLHDQAHAIERAVPPYILAMSWASRREVLESVGAFDEALPHASDVDCAWRLLTAGYRLVYVPQAIAHRRNPATARSLLRAGYARGRDMVRVRARHRELITRAARQHRGPAPPAGTDLPSHWSNLLWRGLVDLGERLGRAHAAWRER
jgi:cellulose synthase/poly-beta-1,6-N-acetylglucosamine synthase-like glycosyltransferase